jgi:DNA-directed RNA polymerase subunit alpha
MIVLRPAIEPTAHLRFLERDGRFILQQLFRITETDDEKKTSIREEWYDVRTERNEVLDKSILKLGLSVRTMNVLIGKYSDPSYALHIKTVRELANLTESDLLMQENCGRKSINEIKEVLAGMGLTLKPKK